MDLSELYPYLLAGYKVSFVVGLISLAAAKHQFPGFLQYGKTLNTSVNNTNRGATLLKKLMYFTVPKALFSHFYFLSIIFSLLTLIRYPKTFITWLIFLHSSRRLYETKYVLKYTPQSRMNWSHYVVGIWFYTTLHLLLHFEVASNKMATNAKPIPMLIFLLASIDQYRNHCTLANLVKYSMPEGGLFKIVCCPHYLDEFLIYASLTLYNSQLCWPLAWVVISLTISAVETRRYYIKKFSRHSRVPSYAVIPLII